MHWSRKRIGIVAVSLLTLLALTTGSALAKPYIVKDGDTLWDLVGDDYAKVAAANHIADPDLIYVGQRIDLDAKVGSSPAPSNSGSNDDVWDRIAECESGGDWGTSTGNGYYGGLQFSLSSWRAAGGEGMPNLASKAEQIRRGKILQRMQGWGAWPVCSVKANARQTEIQPTATSSGSSFRDRAYRIALAQRGEPYRWAADGPSTFDCSGLMVYAYGKVGHPLPHYSGAQQEATTRISLSKAQPGDLLFYPGHVEMYAGTLNGKHYAIAASSAAGEVVLRAMRFSDLLKVGRV